MTAITDDNAPSGTTGHNTVGTTAERHATTPTPLSRGVRVKAKMGNSGTVHVGFSSGITADGTDGTDGFPLYGGDECDIEIDDLSKLYFIGSASGQEYWFHAR